jgi:hypothetical protein
MSLLDQSELDRLSPSELGELEGMIEQARKKMDKFRCRVQPDTDYLTLTMAPSGRLVIQCRGGEDEAASAHLNYPDVGRLIGRLQEIAEEMD